MNGFILLFLFWLWRLLGDAQLLAVQADSILEFMTTNNTERPREVELIFINCPSYCSNMNCDWTREWGCPWDKKVGLLGWATDVHSEAYQCCCEHRKAAEEPCGGPNMVVPVKEVVVAREPVDCTSHCSTQNCDWTSEWSCPWEKTDGYKGRAIADGTKSFECCCNQRKSLEQSCGGIDHPTSQPTVTTTTTTTTTAVVDCADFCLHENCKWTKKWSCSWHYGEGRQGRAVDDGTVAYNCCCIQRQSNKVPCGGHKFTTTSTIRPSKNPVISSIPTKFPSKFPTIYVNSTSSRTSSIPTISPTAQANSPTVSPTATITKGAKPASVEKKTSPDLTKSAVPLPVPEKEQAPEVAITEGPKVLSEAEKISPNNTEAPVLLSEKKQDDKVVNTEGPILLSEKKAEEDVEIEAPVKINTSTSTTTSHPAETISTADKDPGEDKPKPIRNVPSAKELLASLQRGKLAAATKSEARNF